MKTYYLDTNILIDLLTVRDSSAVLYNDIFPYLNHSQIYISALSIHIIFYVLKVKKGDILDKKIQALCKTITIIPLTETITSRAMRIFEKDFEDTLQYISAMEYGCNYILTRDTKDFTKIQKAIPCDIEIINTLEKVK